MKGEQGARAALISCTNTHLIFTVLLHRIQFVQTPLEGRGAAAAASAWRPFDHLSDLAGVRRAIQKHAPRRQPRGLIRRIWAWLTGSGGQRNRMSPAAVRESPMLTICLAIHKFKPHQPENKSA